jgi:glycosyltransferase involved in cell wall biosynthesis
MSHRLALIISELEVGGTQRQILELAKGLDRRLFVPYVCCLSKSLAFAPAFEAAGIPLHVIAKHGRYDCTSLVRLRRFFRKEKIEALVTFGFTADFWARSAAYLAGVPVIISSVRTSNEDISYIHWINRLLASVTDHFIGNSQAVADYLRNRIRVSDSDISVIANGIDISRFSNFSESKKEVRRSLGLDSESFVIGVVNRLSPEKNLDAFIHLAEKLYQRIPQACFIVVGDGPDMERLKVVSNGFEALHWLGERNDVPRILSALDVAMLTSFREGLSNAILEYMASGLPVVASDVGGNSELVRPGQTGFLYPVDNLDFAVDYLFQLFQDAALRQGFGAAAKQVAAREYSIDSMVNKTQDLLLRLLTQKRSSVDISLDNSNTDEGQSAARALGAGPQE